MKKQDNQHLDFLISQYVDGSLEGAGKKSVEQKLLTDPGARGLYTEHQEVQDLLDDWGSRIPLIHWDEFDKKLAARLEREEVGGRRATTFRRWMRPLSAAAALFIAASIGYAWHAWSHDALNEPRGGGVAAVESRPQKMVIIENGSGKDRPNQARLTVEEPAAEVLLAGRRDAGAVAVSAPEDAAAVRSLMESVAFGLGNLPQSMRPQVVPNAVGTAPPTPRMGNGAGETIVP